MRNQITFPDVIGILLENKKKNYTQHQLVRNLFSLCLNDNDNIEITDQDSITYSNWCNGIRPVPRDICETYDEKDSLEEMKKDFETKILPSLINESNARTQIENLINDSRIVIGNTKADELLGLKSNSQFLTAVIHYAVLSEHTRSRLLSPDLSNLLMSNRVPSTVKEFMGRKEELKTAYSLLQKHSLLFVTGIAGIGKSEFVKFFASKYRKKYQNILFIHYEGNLKKCIAALQFADDSAEATEEELFETHYRMLQKLHSDTLIILDSYNILPKDDPFFRKFVQNNFHILITTRCRITSFHSMELKELDKEMELTALFVNYCPSAKENMQCVSDIISEVKSHTLTVCLTALSVTASGMDAEDMLYELKNCGLNISLGETVELYKDGEFTDALMIEHLRKLLEINKLSAAQNDIICNLSLFPSSGVLKKSFKQWMSLTSLNDVNYLARYGFITDDEMNGKISLHPLIQEVAILETQPSVSKCRTLLDNLHLICLVHGLEVRIPDNVINSLISIVEQVIPDIPEYYLFFMQDMFPYLDKYLVTDYLPKLVDRMSAFMDEHKLNSPNNKALLLDYKAELFVLRKEYNNALKKRLKALDILRPCFTPDADLRTVNQLSNLYNNISNIYLLLKNGKKATEAMKQAFAIRKEFKQYETHDTLQQMVNFTNFLILSKEYEQADQLLLFLENIVLETEGVDSFDYAICQLGKGILALHQNEPVHAEICLLDAEQRIVTYMGNDSAYSKTAYRYLHNLYKRWHKNEKALEYRNKLFSAIGNCSAVQQH